ncbi:MAG TPA: thiamine-phosphate kinase [Planctomycetaceae bacterium]|nr:thiamine-phosphate kinase [Planctomycetaceae bacterium]
MAETGGEFGLIEWIRRRVSAHPALDIGIGDDAAVLNWPAEKTLVTVDMLMEGVDFTFPEASPEQVGRKALAVNLSDIAAMGGKPVAAVVSVALPRRHGAELAQRLQQGIEQRAREFDVALAGGDTNSWGGPLVISITVLGEPSARGPVLRSEARAGDWILVTGEFGGSIAGHHLEFTPRVREGQLLAENYDVHAMIDVSDGLAADLHHILDESRVGATLYADRIPISAAALATIDNKTPLEHALSDGEDFELIFTVAAETAQGLLATPPFDTPLTHIGFIEADPGCRLQSADGSQRELPALGWRHEL